MATISAFANAPPHSLTDRRMKDLLTPLVSSNFSHFMEFFSDLKTTFSDLCDLIFTKLSALEAERQVVSVLFQ